jgi:hypothetical protein
MNDLKKFAPDRTAILRALVSSISSVGGALDYLLFDKADAIRARNMASAFDALSEKVQQLGEQAIVKEWFDSEEALAAFKLLSDKASYEPDRAKVDALGGLVATCGTVQHAGDVHKLSVLEHLARLSSVQIKLLSVISSTLPKKKNFKRADWFNLVKRFGGVTSLTR